MPNEAHEIVGEICHADFGRGAGDADGADKELDTWGNRGSESDTSNYRRFDARQGRFKGRNGVDRGESRGFDRGG